MKNAVVEDFLAAMGWLRHLCAVIQQNRGVAWPFNYPPERDALQDTLRVVPHAEEKKRIPFYPGALRIGLRIGAPDSYDPFVRRAADAPAGATTADAKHKTTPVPWVVESETDDVVTLQLLFEKPPTADTGRVVASQVHVYVTDACAEVTYGAHSTVFDFPHPVETGANEGTKFDKSQLDVKLTLRKSRGEGHQARWGTPGAAVAPYHGSDVKARRRRAEERLCEQESLPMRRAHVTHATKRDMRDIMRRRGIDTSADAGPASPMSPLSSSSVVAGRAPGGILVFLAQMAGRDGDKVGKFADIFRKNVSGRKTATTARATRRVPTRCGRSIARASVTPSWTLSSTSTKRPSNSSMASSPTSSTRVPTNAMPLARTS